MIIRKEQMDALAGYVFDAFVRRMALHLRAKCPEHTAAMDGAALEQFIRDSVSRAHSFNIRSETNLVTFLEYSSQYGMDFYAAAPFIGAQSVLENTKLNETEKTNRVNEYLIFR